MALLDHERLCRIEELANQAWGAESFIRKPEAGPNRVEPTGPSSGGLEASKGYSYGPPLSPWLACSEVANLERCPVSPRQL